MLVDLIEHLSQISGAFYTSQRKVIQGVTWETTSLPESRGLLKKLDYTPTKLKRLKSIYYNEDEVTSARQKLEERQASGRDNTSVTILMRNQEKDSRSQGYCITAITVSEIKRPHQISLDITYRSTEAIRKFTADILLIKEVVEALGITPDVYRFYFANIYLSATYAPILAQFTDVINYMELLRKKDKKFFNLVSMALSRNLNPDHNYTFRERVKMAEMTQSLDREPLDAYLLKHLGDYHKPHLPKRRKRRG